MVANSEVVAATKDAANIVDKGEVQLSNGNNINDDS